MAKEQKFRVLTVNECRSQGSFGVGIGKVELTGNVFSMTSSSAAPSCHTASLLSLPCLWFANDESLDHSMIY